MNTRKQRAQAPVQITIPRPCNEDFSAMPEAEGGKFCGRCSQVVVDFTRMTDAQLIDWMRSQRGGCGTFRRDQLNRNLIEPVIRRAPFGMKWLLSLLIVTGCIREERAQKQKRPLSATEQHAMSDDPLKKGEIPPAAGADTLDLKSGADSAHHTIKSRRPAQKRSEPEFPDGIIGNNVLGGIPVEMDPLNEVITDTAKERGSDHEVRKVSEIDRVDVTSGVISATDRLGHDRSNRISGARNSETKFIIDGKQVKPAKKAFWQRVFGHR